MFCKKILCTLGVLFLAASGLWAGDTASFVDLGFSPDGKTYIFAQYGVQSKTLRPWADLFVVDVPRNNFVSGGRISYTHDKPVVSGQDGSGALYRIIARNASLTDKYQVNYCFQGQPLFIALDNPGGNLGSAEPRPQAPAAGPVLPEQAPIEFRDFEIGASYRATLVPFVEGSGTSLKSSFYINLERTTRDGAKKNYTVGTPQLKRSLIVSYRIRKVMIAPNDGSMIFVIEMKRLEDGETNIRYMVEAVRL